LFGPPGDVETNTEFSKRGNKMVASAGGVMPFLELDELFTSSTVHG